MSLRPPLILRIAVPSPLRRHFDYLPPLGEPPPPPGTRVRVPFGRRVVVAVVLAWADQSEWPADKLKRVVQVLDPEPIVPPTLLTFLVWAADYYHHPIGDVLHAVLPATLRQGRANEAHMGVTRWRVTAEGARTAPDALQRAVAQRRLLDALVAAPDGLEAAELAQVTRQWRTPVRALQQRGWVVEEQRDCLLPACPVVSLPPELNPAQHTAVKAIQAALGRYQCVLLHGVTGSGKTEVYLQSLAHLLDQGGQALVLVPEIGLTPQLVQRFQQRFALPIAVLHSGLNDSERLCAWTMASSGKAAIVIGTRSAVFTPMPALRLIVVDEEHDASYKQQDGFRYSARDLAVVRASRDGVPVVLGSATPSLESLHNAMQGRYLLLSLPERTGTALLPRVHLLDLRKLALNDGLSAPLVAAVRERLARGEQSLLFLNRRGFAPVWMCHGCGWLAPCRRCDARLTLHKRSRTLHCHHCGAVAAIPDICPACGAANLHALGEGTERIEDALQALFPTARIERVDRDSTRRKGALQDKLRRIHAGEADILVGTQMLAKGHDFPNLTLVGVVNADQGLYGVDFRSGEQLFQRIAQVAGRAGRADKTGEVLIQTYHPDNPVFSALRHHDYLEYAHYALDERRQAQFPPYTHAALLRTESSSAGVALGFLQDARQHATGLVEADVNLGEAVASPMEKRAGRYRAQLLVTSARRGALHAFLAHWLLWFEQAPQGKRVRWSLDVDPVDMY